MLRRVGRKRLFVLFLSVLFLLAAINVGVSWYYSGVLNKLALEVREAETQYNLTASAIGAGLIKLENGPDHGEWRSPGKWGLSWDDGSGMSGSGMIGDIVEQGDDFLLPAVHPSRWRPTPIRPRVGVRWHLSARSLPSLWHRVRGNQIWNTLGKAGRLAVRGRGRHMAVFVHGLRGEPADGLPSLPVLNDLGIPAIFITYRNDKSQP